MKRRDAIALVLLVMVAAVSWSTGEWWLFWSAIAGSAAATLLRPIQRYYRTASPREQRLVIVANQVFALAVLALYLWLVSNPRTAPGTPGAWVPWLLVMAVPVAIFGMGIVAWRRIDESTGSGTAG